VISVLRRVTISFVAGTLNFRPSKSKHGGGETLQMIGFGGSGLFVMPAVSARRLKMRN
jgi:hypothetical protein